MATLPARAGPPAARDNRFFVRSAVLMTVVIMAGFSLQLAMGRSSFSVPPLVHAHAVVFMGWVILYLLQNVFATTGRTALHRPLGWIGAGWTVVMVVLGCMVTVAMTRRGGVPFFFRPLQFLVFDPMTVVTFAGLTAAAIVLRHRTDCHRRLHFCAMSLLLGPGLGRLLPAPLLQPWAYEATFAVQMFFPLAGILTDFRRHGRAHPAWYWGVAAMVGSVFLTEAITYSPLGTALYRSITAGSPGAAVAPLEFGSAPGSQRSTAGGSI